MGQVLDRRNLRQVDGFDLVAYKMVDEHSSVEDADCYDDEDIAAYEAGRWSFVGVVVKAFREGIELGEDSLWQIEDGHMPGAVSGDNPSGWVSALDYALSEDGADMPGEAIHHAKAALAKLRRDRRAQLRRWPRRRRVAAW